MLDHAGAVACAQWRMAPLHRPSRRELGRAGAASLLLAAGAYGARGLAGLRPDVYVHRPSAPSLIAFAALEAAAAVLVAAALRRPRDGPREPVFGRWTRLLTAAFVLLVVGLPIVLLAVAFARSGSGPVFEFPRWEELPKRKRRRWHDRPDPWTLLWAVVAAVLALAVIAVAAWVAVRRRRSRSVLPVPAVPPPPDGFEDAVAAGSRALRSADDARAAVIACYTAMEGVLAEAGAAPRDSDTPAEVLARASGSGLDGLDAATCSDRPVPGGPLQRPPGDRAAPRGGARRAGIVLATDNPIEYEGTYPLPEAQLDRFALRIRLGYLSPAQESEMISGGSRAARRRPSCACWPGRRRCSPCASASSGCTSTTRSSGTRSRSPRRRASTPR
ncbi:AAA family ATPase [Actinomadura soli]|uniref:AAA family ATPase n=1 Tax=Actinomadura soli TaxID=2508997 RepID=UPI00197AF13E|nr:AAA family ATPase [Actinomadura soli]